MRCLTFRGQKASNTPANSCHWATPLAGCSGTKPVASHPSRACLAVRCTETQQRALGGTAMLPVPGRKGQGLLRHGCGVRGGGVWGVRVTGWAARPHPHLSHPGGGVHQGQHRWSICQGNTLFIYIPETPGGLGHGQPTGWVSVHIVIFWHQGPGGAGPGRRVCEVRG